MHVPVKSEDIQYLFLLVEHPELGFHWVKDFGCNVRGKMEKGTRFGKILECQGPQATKGPTVHLCRVAH